MNMGNRNNIVLEMLGKGEEVRESDISDCMVGFVYDRLLEPIEEAFLDITTYFYNWKGKEVAA